MFLFIHHFNYIDKNNFEKLLNNISTNLSNSKRIIIKESNRLNIISRLIHFIIKEKNMVNITPFYLLNTLKNNGYVIEKIYFYGFMMPKVSKKLYIIFKLLESIIEKLPVLKYILTSHYIIIAKKQ